MSYSSIVSRESARVIFLIAAANTYDFMAADVQNDYVQATSLEKYYTITDDEFREDKGQTALVARASYGWKSSGARW
jgi:hypothetical protein